MEWLERAKVVFGAWSYQASKRTSLDDDDDSSIQDKAINAYWKPVSLL